MIGASIRRKEDPRFITGRGRFVDDIVLPRMLHAVVVRSPMARARLRHLDTGRARALAGVVDCVTFADIASVPPIPIRFGPDPALDPCLQHPLAGEETRYVGEPVAVLAAESRYLAEDAAALVEADWEPLPAVVDVEAALAPAAPRVHPGGNVAAASTIDLGDVPSAFREADHVLRTRFKIGRHSGIPLETRGLVAEHDRVAGVIRMWGPTKTPWINRSMLAAMLRVGEEQIHFVEPDVGGGFGIRGDFYPEDFLVPFLAVRTGRPVKWIETRREHLQAANHSRGQAWEIAVAARCDGVLLAIDATLVHDMGAYVRTQGLLIPAVASAHLTGPYRIRSYRCQVTSVFTNRTPTGTMRGPGLFEGNFVRERAVDMVAHALDLDPTEVRRRNLIGADEMPYTVGTSFLGIPTIYDSGDFPKALEAAIGAAAGFGERPAPDGRLSGVGVALLVEPTGTGPFEAAKVVVDRTGKIYVSSGVSSWGQGQETTLAQICADVLGVSVDDVMVRHGDTALLRYGAGSYASRGMVMAGSAVFQAAQRVRDRALRAAGHHLEAAVEDLVLRQGRIHVAGVPERGLTLAQIAQALSPGYRGPIRRPVPAEDGEGLEALAHFRYTGREGATAVFSVHAAAVTVDPETDLVEVSRYLVACDLGRAINPMIVEGQLQGGAVQGIGGALREEFVYDEAGQLLTSTLMDYALATAVDAPPVEALLIEGNLSPLNPLGVKGIGEAGTSGAGAAVANAVADALRPLGVEITDLPLTPSRIFAAIQRAGGPSARAPKSVTQEEG